MKATILALIISLGLLFSGPQLQKIGTASVMAAQPEHQIVPDKHFRLYTPNINYLYTKPGMTFSIQRNMYYYRDLDNYYFDDYRPLVNRKYVFPILGRILRTHIDIHGPEGRGVTLGVGRHTHGVEK